MHDRQPGTPRPTELAITLAALPRRYSRPGTWSSADEIRGRLALLGFDCTTQQVAAYLARMARADAPWVERCQDPWTGCWEYRVTNWGRNDIDNRFPGVRPAEDPIRARPIPLCGATT